MFLALNERSKKENKKKTRKKERKATKKYGKIRRNDKNPKKCRK